ncbi:MAG TPA: hypothetical protein VGJ69_07260 [Pyrinomonadaceae bacterium]|jgi:hypothetical protein
MKIKIAVLLGIALVLALGLKLSPTNGVSSSQGDEGQRRLESLAKDLKLDVGKITNSGTVQNMVGIRSENVLFSQRRDSRTYFIQDARYGPDKNAGVFQGSDEMLVERSRSVLKVLDIPSDEISKANILREKTQAGYIDRRTRKVVPEAPRDGKVYAEFWRQVSGVPVFSSRALVGLTKEGTVGFMELHWPVIPKATVEEGRRLQALVRGRWQPPSQKDAVVESVEAGIIHSPALGFVMDIYPAIRVIYRAADYKVGRKMTLYLDGNGRPVPVPRQFEKVETTPAKTRPRK